LVDPRVSKASGGETAVAALDAAAAYDTLVWLRERAQQAAEDAPPSEGAFLRALAESYRGAAASIAYQPPLSTGPYSPLEVTGSAQIALTYDSERQVDFVVRNVSSTNLKVWVTAEWDSQFVSVASSA